MTRRISAIGAIVSLMALAIAAPAAAAPFLTAAGAAAGFSLSTFVDGIPGGAVGPVGIMNTPGGILITGYGSGEMKTFTDVDGHHWSDVASAANYGVGNPAGVAALGGKYYLVQQTGDRVTEITATGVAVADIVTIDFATGIVANPNNGHLFVSNVSKIYDVDPVLHTATVFAHHGADGLSMSADGTTLYAAVLCCSAYANNIIGMNSTTAAITYASGFVGGGIDGTALGSGSLSGNIYVNNNNGTVVQIDLTTNLQTVIVAGGTRGDLAWVDTTNGTFLFTQSHEVMRLTAPTGGGFETTSGAPEPSALLLVSLGLIGLGLWRRQSA